MSVKVLKILFAELSDTWNILILCLSMILGERNRELTVEIETISSLIFEDILQFIYIGRIIITVDNFEEILSANKIYGIKSLQAACEEAITKLLTTKSYKKLRSVASKW